MKIEKDMNKYLQNWPCVYLLIIVFFYLFIYSGTKIQRNMDFFSKFTLNCKKI